MEATCQTRRTCRHCRRVIADDRRTCGTCQTDRGPAACLICERRVLSRPGTCYSCSLNHGFDPNSEPPPMNAQRVDAARDHAHEARVAEYERRAELAKVAGEDADHNAGLSAPSLFDHDHWGAG